MKNKIAPLVIAAMFGLTFACYAAEINEEELTPKNKKIYLEEQDAEKPFLERGKLKNIVGVSEGYDNNTHLDSTRDGDAYTQAYFKTSFTSPVNEKTNAIFEYELMSLLYSGESNLDLVKNTLHAGMEHKFNKDLIFSSGYSVDDIEYINTGSDDYLENRVESKLKQNLPFKMYHSLGYELGYKNYIERHTRSFDLINSDKKRADFRHTVDYEIGKYFKSDFVKVAFEYFNNNSNETFLKYYDYDSFKVGAAVTHLFNEKFFAYFSLFRQYRDYRSRTLSLDANSKEWERTYLVTSALYYNMNKAFTLGLSYTYRQNWANEPLDNYSGSLIALSSYYRF